MNKFTKWTGILAAFCLTAMTLSLAGCGDGGKNSVKNIRSISKPTAAARPLPSRLKRAEKL